jgi:hypothetical protein
MAYEIQISARNLSWPRLCACCCGPANTMKRASASRTTGKRVRHTTTAWWEVPYCTSCLSQEALFRWAATILVGAVAAIAIVFLIASLNDSPITAACSSSLS